MLHPNELHSTLMSYTVPVLWIRDVYPGSRIPDPDFYPSRIPDLGSKNSNKRERWKKLVVIPFCVATNFTKLKIIFVLKCRRKTFGPIFKDLLNFLPQKLSQSSQKYGFGIRDPEKTYSGSRIQRSKRIRNTAFRMTAMLSCLMTRSTTSRAVVAVVTLMRTLVPCARPVSYAAYT